MHTTPARSRRNRNHCLMGAALLVSATPKPRSADTERAIAAVRRIVETSKANGVHAERINGMLLAIEAIAYVDDVVRGEA
jgi:hypothetical protein